MLIVGLTGGIGSGKSTVADMLARRGAVVIDADVVAREVVEPGTDGFREVVEAFGDEVVAPDGGLDRAKLAGIVFPDPDKRRTLESIVHPRVGLRIAELIAEHHSSGRVVVLDVPLLAEAESSRRMADTIVVVTSDEETRLRRLEGRGVDREDARARMAAQASDAERLSLADHVIANDGSLEDTERQVEELWRSLRERAEAPA